MKKLLVLTLVLALTSVSFATLVGLGAPAEGDPGSMTNPLAESDTIIIPITSDGGGLLGLDALIEVVGPGSITGAIGQADAGTYGWDPAFAFAPDLAAQAVEVGQGNFSGNFDTTVGYVEIHCDGPGEITISIVNASAFGGSADMSFNVPDFGGPITIYQIPEPMTVALLGLGGLFLRRRK